MQRISATHSDKGKETKEILPEETSTFSLLAVLETTRILKTTTKKE
jgi:hypothetical protein